MLKKVEKWIQVELRRSGRYPCSLRSPQCERSAARPCIGGQGNVAVLVMRLQNLVTPAVIPLTQSIDLHLAEEDEQTSQQATREICIAPSPRRPRSKTGAKGSNKQNLLSF